MRRRKCFIGVVAFMGANPMTLQNYMAFAFDLGRRHPDIDFYLQVIGKKEQFRARNNLVNSAKGWMHDPNDLLMMLDDDMILPQHTFERLKNILDTIPDAGVAGGLYWQRAGSYRPVIQKIIYQGDAVATQWYQPHEITGGIMQVGVLGGGCLLMPMRAVQALMPPAFWVDGIVGTDVHFCIRLNQAGFNAYCDTGLEIGHVSDGISITSKNLPTHIKKFAKFCKDLEESTCNYLKIDRQALESWQLSGLWALENKWAEKPRETFDAIKDAYLSIGNTAVVRNVFYACNGNTAVEGFAGLIETVDRELINKDYPILDYGCGVGIATEILAQGGYQVEAMDLADSAVLKFAEWRLKEHGVIDRVTIRPVTSFMPEFQEKYSALILLDILEHLDNPHEILETLLQRLIPGGYLHTNFAACEFKGAEAEIPQHLKKISVPEFEALLDKYGFRLINNLLFQKKKEA